MTDLVYLVPTRGRPSNVARLIEAFAENCRADTLLFFVTDKDDPTKHETFGVVESCGYMEVGVLEWNGPRGQVAPLNFAALATLTMEDTFALGVMGDDHVPRTVGWDQKYLDAIKDGGWVYGNDLIQGEKLATEVVVSSDVVKTLGWFTYPGLEHLYCDNVWTDLGRATNRLTYLPDVIVEHMHYTVGKSEEDDTYRYVNSDERWSEDRKAYVKWRDYQLVENVKLLKEKLQW